MCPHTLKLLCINRRSHIRPHTQSMCPHTQSIYVCSYSIYLSSYSICLCVVRRHRYRKTSYGVRPQCLCRKPPTTATGGVACRFPCAAARRHSRRLPQTTRQHTSAYVKIRDRTLDITRQHTVGAYGTAGAPAAMFSRLLCMYSSTICTFEVSQRD